MEINWIWAILALAFLRWNHVVSQINKEIDHEFEKFVADQKRSKERNIRWK